MSAETVPAAFRAGDRVRVREGDPPGHVRAPSYVRGRPGEVILMVDCFANPEDLAYGRTGGPRVPLYRVRFRQADLWPRSRGAARDTVDVEIYQHWLEADGEDNGR
jgi:nitrile hydratase